MVEQAVEPAPASEPLLSVRGDVSRYVDPDSVELMTLIEITRESKDDALRTAAVAVESVRSSLQQLGGVIQGASTLRHPLTWSTRRVSTTHEYDQAARANTGRTVAEANVSIFVRDFDILESVQQLASEIGGLRFIYVTWHVDADNPAWRSLRLEAIDEAMRKGRDYAAALRSSLVRVEHVADLGLLGSAHEERLRGAGGGSGASFDPVPQKLSAAIEARFRISAVPIDVL